MKRDIKKGEQLRSEEDLELDEKNNNHIRNERFKNAWNNICLYGMWFIAVALAVAFIYTALRDPDKVFDRLISGALGLFTGLFLKHIRKNIDQ